MRHVVEAEFWSYHRQIDHFGLYTLIHFIEMTCSFLFCFLAGLQLKLSVLQGD